MTPEEGADLGTGEIYQPGGPAGLDGTSFMNRVYATMGVNAADIPSATYWPSVSAERARSAWSQLRQYVDDLCSRFEFLDHHVIPHCWWQHNQHVEALVALRDYERVSYTELAPATAPVDWLRALRDTAASMQTWTGQLACGATHQPPVQLAAPVDEEGWERHVRSDVARRSQPAGATHCNHRSGSGLKVAVEGEDTLSGEETPDARY